MGQGRPSRAWFAAGILFMTIVSYPAAGAAKDDEAVAQAVLDAYARGGEAGVKEYAQSHRKVISSGLVIQMADRGLQERTEPSLAAARILAAEMRSGKAEADVCSRYADFCYLTSEFGRAEEFLQEADALYTALKDFSGLGRVKKRAADIYSRSGRNEKAGEMLDAAQESYEKAGDVCGQMNVCSSRWYSAFVAGDFAKARQALDQGVSLSARCNDPKGLAGLHRSMGFMNFMVGDNEEALAAYEKSLPLFVQAGDPQGQGNVLRGIGDVYSKRGEYEKALEAYGRALPFLEQIRDLLGQAYLCDSQGEILWRRGETAKSIEMHQKALQLFVRTGNLAGQADSYFEMATAYEQWGDNARALEELEKAWPLFVQGEDLYGQANTLLQQAEIAAKTGENARALALLAQALPIYQKIEDPDGEGNSYYLWGDIYLNLGELDRAREFYEKAQPIYAKADLMPDQGNVHFRIGDILLRKGDAAGALVEFSHAQGFLEKVEDLRGLALVDFRQGAAYLMMGRLDEARSLFERSFELCVRVGYVEGQGHAYEGLAEQSLACGEDEKALEYAGKAQEIYRRIGTKGRERDMLFLKAKILERKQRMDEAADLYMRGIAAIEQIRSGAGLFEMKQAFMTNAIDAYQEAAEFMLRHGYDEQAFSCVEGTRARVFLDRLAEGMVDLEGGVPDELRKRRDDLENALSILERRRKDEGNKERPDASAIVAIESEMEKTGAALDQVRAGIRLKNPRYASVRYPEPVSLKRLQGSVVRADETVLEYVLFTKDAWCLAVSPGSFVKVKLPAGTEEITRLVRLWLLDAGSPKGSERSLRTTHLYDALIAPVKKQIARKRLVVVPDGILARLPFEALWTGHGYLFEEHGVSYVPSASVLEILRATERPAGAGARFLGFGDPVYDYESFAKGVPERGAVEEAGAPATGSEDYLRAGGKLDRLEGSGIEVTDIGSHVRQKGGKATVRLRLDASEAHAKSQVVASYDYVHFAAHGVLTDRFQGIALSHLPDDREDGVLTMGEIMNLPCNARAVVLSACETGLGREEKGEGVTGLARAVMYAGSPAAVVSLWKVSDVATKELMMRFYERLLAGPCGVSEALRRAKLDLLRSRDRRHPFYWAAFVTYGE